MSTEGEGLESIDDETTNDREIPTLDENGGLAIKLVVVAIVVGGVIYAIYYFGNLYFKLEEKKEVIEHGEISTSKLELPAIVSQAATYMTETTQEIIDEEEAVEPEEESLSDAEKRRRSGPLTIYTASIGGKKETPKHRQERASRDDYLNSMMSMAKEMSGQGEKPEKTLNDSLDIANTTGVTAKQITDLSSKLLQGKMISATLETAIQSDLSGMARAVLTEPVYSADGRRLLVSQGSRAIGQYKGGMEQGQARVFVIWQRIITPQGTDIALNSPGTGPLGRAGHSGWIESHFMERFGASMLLSVISGGAGAAAGLAANGNQEAIQGAQDGFNRSSEIALQNAINIKPTLHKNQGEAIKIFVARDIDFRNISMASYAR